MLVEITFTNGKVAELEFPADFQVYLQNVDANEGKPYLNDEVWNAVFTLAPWVAKKGEYLKIKNLEIVA